MHAAAKGPSSSKPYFLDQKPAFEITDPSFTKPKVQVWTTEIHHLFKTLIFLEELRQQNPFFITPNYATCENSPKILSYSLQSKFSEAAYKNQYLFLVKRLKTLNNDYPIPDCDGLEDVAERLTELMNENEARYNAIVQELKAKNKELLGL